MTMRGSYLFDYALKFKRWSIWCWLLFILIILVFCLKIILNLSIIVRSIFEKRHVLIPSCQSLNPWPCPFYGILHFLQPYLGLRHVDPLLNHDWGLIPRWQVVIDMQVFRPTGDIRFDNWLDLLIFITSPNWSWSLELLVVWLFVSIETGTLRWCPSIKIPRKLSLKCCIFLKKHLFIDSILLFLFLDQVLSSDFLEAHYSVTVIRLSFLCTIGTVGLAWFSRFLKCIFSRSIAFICLRLFVTFRLFWPAFKFSDAALALSNSFVWYT